MTRWKVVTGAQATTHAAGITTTATARPITPPNDTRTAATAGRALPTGPRTGGRVGAAKRCPACRALLDGGPVRFRCAPCGKAATAADLDTEYHPPTTTGRTAA